MLRNLERSPRRRAVSCRLTLSLSANLQESAKEFFENGSTPSGMLFMPRARASAR
jgi:hypothetical protein